MSTGDHIGKGCIVWETPDGEFVALGTYADHKRLLPKGCIYRGSTWWDSLPEFYKALREQDKKRQGDAEE